VGGKASAALGFKAHTGWAAAVLLAGTPESHRIVAKEHVQMAADFAEAGVYHASQDLAVQKAAALIDGAARRFARAAREAIGSLAKLAAGAGYSLVGAGIVAGKAKPLPPLAAILRSHALVHTAEGELFRRVLGDACASLEVPAIFVPSGELVARACRASGLREEEISERLAALGKASGRPWTADQKESTLAALVVLGP
jgi:hypothetical protein